MGKKEGFLARRYYLAYLWPFFLQKILLVFYWRNLRAWITCIPSKPLIIFKGGVTWVNSENELKEIDFSWLRFMGW